VVSRRRANRQIADRVVVSVCTELAGLPAATDPAPVPAGCEWRWALDVAQAKLAATVLVE
jgi:hypothetical protein